MKILVLFTGGTIGSTVVDNVINVNDSTSRVILNGFSSAYPDEQVDFTILQPMNILSENITPKHWQVIYNALLEADFTSYDGVIITHGSDTISYTSAFVGFCFGNTPVPIVLTCSNYVLTNPKSNGQANFNNAVLLVTRNNMRGVFVVFQDSKRRNKVYLATRLQEADPYHDQFSSCGGADYGELIEGKFLPKLIKTNPKLPKKEKITAYKPNLPPVDNACEVMAIKAYPGLNYNNYALTSKTKAVLCNLYHSSSNCIEKNEYSITEFISRCKSNGVDVYLMSFKKVYGDLYQTTKLIVESGGIPLVNISFEAAYVKLNLAYNLPNLNTREFMQKEIFYERVAKPEGGK